MPRFTLTRGMRDAFLAFNLDKWEAGGLKDWIRHRVGLAYQRGGDSPITFLSAGCASATDINQIVDSLRLTNRGVRHRIIGLGLDLNPVPELAQRVQLPFERVERPDFKIPALRGIQLMRGDVADMHMLPDSSIDGLWLMGVMAYVRDKLAVLNEIDRVLKPGGFSFASSVGAALTGPPLEEILEDTQGGENFSLYRDQGAYPSMGGRCVIGYYKPEDPRDNEFRGFDYEFTTAHRVRSNCPPGSHRELFCCSEYR